MDGTESKAIITATFNKVAILLMNMAMRWQDEKDYEDIEDYKARILTELPKEMHLIKMTKRPFGFQFRMLDHNRAYFMIAKLSGDVAWGVVK